MKTKRVAPLLVPLLVLNVGAMASTDSGDAFSLFSEEARVMTASLRPQAIQDVPVAVDVVSADEIKASGATNLWDLLRFRAGVDVVDGHSALDGNRAIVSVRGFPQVFAANLQVLVDGRSVYKATNDGTYWDQLPVQIQDIERIEIIRGPNSALYGTGAGLGVINILTKKPAGDTRLSIDNRAGDLGMFQSSEALESHVGKAAFRASYTYRRQDGFPSAATGDEANDFLNKQVANIRADIPLSDRSSLAVFTGGSRTNSGAPGGLDTRTAYTDEFQMLKFSQSLSPDSSWEVTASRGDSDSILRPTATGETVNRNLQYDVQALHRLDWGRKRFNTTYGAAYRSAIADSTQQFPGDSQANVEFSRFFLSQMINPFSILSLQGSASLEHSSVSGLLPSYQAAAILRPTPSQAFRASYSAARTVQDLFPLFADSLIAPGVRFVGDPDLPPYRITSYELGYRGDFLERRVQVDQSLFYTLVDNFHMARFQSFTVPPPLTTLRFTAYDNAIARGSESSLKYHFSASRWAYVNYTYEKITDSAGDEAIRVKNTPQHKVNFGGSCALGRGVTASVNVGYKDAYFLGFETGGSVHVPAYWRVDARLGYAPGAWRGAELYVAGQNLTTPQHIEAPDGLAVPRTYQAGVSMKIGGR